MNNDAFLGIDALWRRMSGDPGYLGDLARRSTELGQGVIDAAKTGYPDDLARRSTELGQGVIDAAKTGGAWGVAKNVGGIIRSGYRDIWDKGAAPAASAIATIAAGPAAGDAVRQAIAPAPQTPMTPSDKARSDANKLPTAAAGKTNDKKPEGFGTNRVALDDNGSYVESANKAGIDRVRAGLAGNHAGGLTIMPNDQTGATMEQERLHREGMARLRSGMPYDANEAARFQQQQQMGQLFDIATGNSQVPRKGLGTRKLAADLLGSMHQFGAQHDYQNAVLDENRRYHDLQIGVDRAKQAQPSVEKISSPYPVFDQFGNPVRNPKNNEVQLQNIPELMVNGVRQPSEQALGVLQHAAELQAQNDPRAHVPWYNPFKSSVDPQDLVAEKLNGLNAQYGVNKKLVRGPNGEPMWEVPDLNLLGVGTSR